MRRSAVVAFTLLLTAIPFTAHGDDGDEVKRLTDRVKQLEAKLKTAETEIDDLKNENEQLKSKQPAVAKKPAKEILSDLLPAGSVLNGDYVFTKGPGGPGGKGDVTVTIDKRDGNKFKGTYHIFNQREANNAKVNVEAPTHEIEGVFTGDGIRFNGAGAKKFTVFGSRVKDNLRVKYQNPDGVEADMVLKLPK